jgi:ribosomal 30S subunit maturation factor RimM
VSAEAVAEVDAPAEAGSDWDDLILVGVVARTHGNRGHVIVNPHTDFIEDRFRVGARFETMLTDGTRLMSEVTAARVHQGRPVIGLAEVTSIDEAERYWRRSSDRGGRTAGAARGALLSTS